MAQFGAIESATAGFRLIGRRPLSYLAWVATWIVLGLGPLLLTLAVLVPQFLDFLHGVQHMAPDQKNEAVGRLVRFEFAVAAASGPSFIWMLLVQTLLFCAMARAMLEPGKGAFAYLRIGMDEVRVLIAEIVLMVLGFVFFSLIACAIVLVIAFGASAPHPWAGWLQGSGVVALIGFAIYAPFKLSLAVPATFAEKELRIFRSWRLTKGRFWSILGMWLVALLLAIVLLVVTFVILKAVVVGVAFGTGGVAAIASVFRRVSSGEGVDLASALPDLLRALGPAVIVGLLIQSCIQVLARVAVSAPFVSAYASLSGREED